MRGCRWSRSLLLLGAGLYLAAAGLHIALETLITPPVRQLLLEASLLAGHQCVYFSMWLHARHVLHCTVDPAIQSRSSWSIPRPHFRLPKLRRKSAVRPESRETSVSAPHVPRAPARTEQTPQSHDEPEPIPKPALPAADDLPPVAPVETTEAIADVEEAEQFPAKPEMRGLSKKQRRRLMQELRERERASGR